MNDCVKLQKFKYAVFDGTVKSAKDIAEYTKQQIRYEHLFEYYQPEDGLYNEETSIEFVDPDYFRFGRLYEGTVIVFEDNNGSVDVADYFPDMDSFLDKYKRVEVI